ncbi:MAG: PDZ domain-containing protein [Xanthomonadales bacterium]|nr:PDZ domain-containing protein [Xanthomonadales bacterium]
MKALNYLTLAALLALAGPMYAQDSWESAEAEEEMRALQKELREAQEQLQQLNRRMNRLNPDGNRFPNRTVNRYFSGEPRPMIGIVMSQENSGRGVRLSGVTPEAPAARAGMKSGDWIVEINGESVKGKRGLDKAYKLLGKIEEGNQYDFVVDRDGERIEFTVTAEVHEPTVNWNFTYSGDWPEFNFEEGQFSMNLGREGLVMDLDEFKDFGQKFRNWQFELDEDTLKNLKRFQGTGMGGPYLWGAGLAWSDLELTALNPKLARYFGTDEGVLVIDSELEDSSLEGGDVIIAIDGERVTRPREAMRALAEFQPGDTVDLTVVRDGREMALTQVVPEFEGNAFFYRTYTDSRDDQ